LARVDSLKNITIPEHGRGDQCLDDEGVIKYIDNFLAQNRIERGEKGGIGIVEKDGTKWLANSSYVGVLAYGDHRISFKPKFDLNVIFMLPFLQDIGLFKVDYESKVNLDTGDCFFDFLGVLFVHEIDPILERGLLKRYVNKEENLRFLKGRLLIGRDIQANLGFKPQMYCSYYDLTYDNLENRLVLRALNLLIPLLSDSTEIEKTKLRLLEAQNQLLQEVTLDPGLGSIDCDMVRLDRLNERYSDILHLARLILEQSFINSTADGSVSGFNFLVDMNKLYEHFVTEIIRQIVNEHYPEFTVRAQYSLKDLDRQGKLTTKPDIVLMRNGKVQVIIDAKYKFDLTNTDAYQMIAYSLAMPNSRISCLIYPREINSRELDLDIWRNLDREESGTYPLWTRFIDLAMRQGETYSSYITRVKRNLEPVISSLIERESPRGLKPS
jgi:5-methylcytosine-specific restriction enzyme subunit McrC